MKKRPKLKYLYNWDKNEWEVSLVDKALLREYYMQYLLLYLGLSEE